MDGTNNKITCDGRFKNIRTANPIISKVGSLIKWAVEFDFGSNTLQIDGTESETVTLGTGSGTFQVGEDVTQTNSTSGITVTGEVSTVGTSEIEISSQVASDGSNTLFAPTSGSAPGNIIGSTSGASYAISSKDAFSSIDSNDAYSDNEDFELIGNNFIDFSETNPFGEVDITT